MNTAPDPGSTTTNPTALAAQELSSGRPSARVVRSRTGDRTGPEVGRRNHGQGPHHHPIDPRDLESLGTQTAFQDAVHSPHQALRARLVRVLDVPDNIPLGRQADALRNCGTGAGLTPADEPGKLRPYMSRCKQRLCPFCAQARANKLAGDLTAEVLSMSHPKTLVLTVKSRTAPLAEQLHHLRDSFRKLRRTPTWRNTVARGVYVIEITVNADTGLWHPHLHAIIDGGYLPQKLLRKAWFDATGDSEIVWIQAVKDPTAAAWDTAKYAGKPAKIHTLTEDQLREYALAVRSQRMIQGFGKKAAPVVNDEDTKALDAPKVSGIGLAALLDMTNAGHAAPARLLYLAALRWPTYGRYVWDHMPSFTPDGLDPAVVAPFDNLIPAPTSPPPRGGDRAGPHDRLDAALWEAWTDFANERSQGKYSTGWDAVRKQKPPTFADVCPDFVLGMVRDDNRHR